VQEPPTLVKNHSKQISPYIPTITVTEKNTFNNKYNNILEADITYALGPIPYARV
jgi:hypothetical protein